jgi:hypothetical protein
MAMTGEQLQFYWKGYADAIRHADIQLQAKGDDRQIRGCRAAVLSLVKAEYHADHAVPIPTWPKTLEGVEI